MPDDKEFKIKISTSATGDGAEETSAKLDLVAASSKKLQLQLVEAQEALTNLQWRDDGSKESTMEMAVAEEKVAKLKVALEKLNEVSAAAVQPQEQLAEAVKKTGKEAEEAGEKSVISHRKLVGLASVAGQLIGAAATGGEGMGPLEKLMKITEGIAASTGHIEIALLIASLDGLWKSLDKGHHAQKEHEAEMEKVRKKAEETADAMRKLKEEEEKIADAPNGLKQKWELIFEEVDRSVKRMGDAIKRQAEIDKDDKAIEVARVRDLEDEKVISHVEAVKQIEVIDEKYRLKKYKTDFDALALAAKAAGDEKYKKEQEANELQERLAAQRTKIEDAQKVEKIKTDYAKVVREKVAVNELRENNDMNNKVIGNAPGDGTEWAKTEAMLVEGLDKKDEQLKELISKLDAAQDKDPKLGTAVEEQKEYNKLLSETNGLMEEIEKKRRVATEAFNKAHTKMDEMPADLQAERNANLYKDDKAERNAAKQDEDEKNKGEHKAEKPLDKAVSEGEKALKDKDSEEKKSVGDVRKKVSDLVHIMEKEKSAPDYHAKAVTLTNLSRALDTNPKDDNALKQLATIMNKYQGSKESAMGGVIGLMQQSLGTAHEQLGVMKTMKAQLDAQRQEVASLKSQVDSAATSN